MRTIVKKEDLNRPIEKNDIVIFCYKGIFVEYIVRGYFLMREGSGYNDQIFKLLKINPINFTREHYGYNPSIGDWPSCEPGDYEALTRVVKALYEEIEKQETEKPFKSLKETHDEYEKTNKEKTVIKKIQFIKHLKIKGD